VSKPLDELYFVWLYNQVGDSKIKNPTRTYWRILRQLYTKEFVWIVPNDDNRIEDGKDLRQEFADQAKLKNIDETWMRLGCSMLELIVGLSRRLSFELEGEPRDWFWHLIHNIGLDGYTDSYVPKSHTSEHIDSILEQLIWRTYHSDGHGGLFPLVDPHEDQRKVELWYQLSAYVLERS
jgi:hypothetical protein